MGQFEDMGTFVRIAEAGSISRAADQLGVAKSAVSRRLADFETRLGINLINRSTRSSSLTEAGKSYYERAVKILEDVNELNAAAKGAKTSLVGSMKIAVPLSFGLQHLTPAINDFAAAHPEVSIHMDFSDRQVDLIEEGLDLAIRIADLRDSSLIARKIAPIRRVLCASPEYLDRHGFPEKPEDLKSHQALRYDIAPGTAWRFTGPDGGEESVTPQLRMSANNGEFLHEAALAGFGLVILPSFIVWKDLAAGRYAVYPQTRYLSQRVRSFIDFLKERFSGTPYWDDCLQEQSCR
jgi:DNA-binding transcriptional LysR family regulator